MTDYRFFSSKNV